MNLRTPIGQLNRVGKTLEKNLKHLSLESVRDLLFYFPFRYEDFSQIKLIKDLQDGEQVSIKGQIELIASRRSFKKRKIITEAVVVDSSDRIKVIWFGQPFITKVLKPGDEVYLSGKVKSDMLGLQMVGPSYERVNTSHLSSPNRGGGQMHTARIVPMYALTGGITQKQIRYLVSQIIDLTKNIKEWLPQEILEQADLVPLAEAIRGIHFPVDQIDLKQSEKRIKFGELFILQLRAEMIRQSLKSSIAPELKFKEDEIKNFVASLPFELTKPQKISSWEILKDLEKIQPMNRLLEGDVGSGKTVVAAMAMYNTVLNGYQAVLMAPTEILAFQHFQSLKQLLGDRASLGLLTRSQFLISNFSPPQRDPVFIAGQFPIKSKLLNDKITKRQVVEMIRDGEVNVIIGTHALLSEGVEFKNLGLVIVDEQHRFGVNQRAVLRQRESALIPHYLSMTATPIPRTFALTLYGDLDLSIINELPANRKIIKTRLVEPHNREKAYQFIRDQVKLGRQVFVICPLISQKEKVKIKKNENEIEIINYPDYRLFNNQEKKSVMEEYEKLSKQIFPDLKVGFLHGKLKSKEKEEVMNKFSKGELNILVSTSVVEVGVDIPNASVMMIEDAERFGLAQLHQFRGRVGRSVYQSYCLLFTNSDSQKTMERLKYFEINHDGFKVAEYDLEVRGPGEVYGTEQSGMMNLRLATLQDKELIKLARDLARGIDFAKFPVLKNKVKEWEERVHLE